MVILPRLVSSKLPWFPLGVFFLVLSNSIAIRGLGDQSDSEILATEQISADLPKEVVEDLESGLGTNSDQPSEAHRIAELQKTIQEEREQLQALELEIESPQGEYASAERDFLELNDDVERESQALETARNSNDQIVMQRLELEIASIERKRKLAEARFELAIEDRKAVREQMQTLRRKIKNDQTALDSLTGDHEPSVDDELLTDKDAEASTKVNDEPSHVSTASDDEKLREQKKNESTPEDVAENSETKDEELVEAQSVAEEKESEAEEAQKETQSIADRMADLQKLIAQEQKELSIARKKVDLADSAQLGFTTEIAKRQSEKADEAELAELRADASDASRRLIFARSEVNAIVERLNDHRTDLGVLQSEHILALHEAENKRQAALVADERVESLRNPLAPRNILLWIYAHGIRLFAIVIGMVFLNHIACFASYRSIRLVSAGTGRGTKLERENRARTLVGVFQNAATVVIFITGFLMILEEVGANVTVLMGGVAVIGLAVAFGAQNLIKDYFYGFVMLLENQYMLNDSIRIGSLSGQVERITLRMTVLRDSSGVVHFVPNGTIECVSNETHGWSRSVCEISVGYDEDLDHVMAVLAEIGQELHADSKYGPLMLEGPDHPSIDAFGESSIKIKNSAKTLPNKHGVLKQEWLRRIKRRFSQLGIQPAYPQRMLRIEPESIEAVRQVQLRNRPAA